MTSKSIIADYYDSLGINKGKAKELQNEKLYNLHKVPKKESKDNMPTVQQCKHGFIQQADLLFMPNDDGYRWALVITDIGSRLTDAEPLKSKKPEEVVKAFKAIYGRKVLSIPKEELDVDAGNEFKGALKTYFDKCINQNGKSRTSQTTSVSRIKE